MKMKKILFATAILVAVASCDKENKDKELTWSPLTVEQQKQKIEENSIALIDNVEKLKNTDAYKAIYKFTDYLDASYSSSPARRIVAPFKSLVANIKDGKTTKITNDFHKSLLAICKHPKSENDGNPFGVWEWTWASDDSMGWMEKKEDYNDYRIVVKIPTGTDPKVNNCVITVVYTESTVDWHNDLNEMKEGLEEDLNFDIPKMPSAIAIDMKVDNKTVLSANYNATYKADGIPAQLSQTLSIDDFVLAFNVNYNDSEITSNTSFKKGSTDLLKVENNIKGKLNYNNLLTIEENGFGDVISSVSVKFQMMDIAVAGSVDDAKGFFTEMKNVGDLPEEEYHKKECEVFNKYCKVYAYFVNDNTKFAEVEFFVKQYNDSYGSHYTTALRFIMSDGSKVEIEDYMETGFDDLQKRIESLIDNLF